MGCSECRQNEVTETPGRGGKRGREKQTEKEGTQANVIWKK